MLRLSDRGLGYFRPKVFSIFEGHKMPSSVSLYKKALSRDKLCQRQKQSHGGQISPPEGNTNLDHVFETKKWE